ncbi:FadR/GntR family transcriptional regulator [Microtetraspora malaysiensis]|uniref:FadR/GntR family transcriptional regulator n=1 Tax=Microtetraspora malaysiensis TaxID=161358 RepID=UPI003D8EECDC
MTIPEEPTPTVLFRPISGTRAFEEVVGQITYAIRAGYYAPGDKLPTVAELAELLRVSRPTVGDAVHVLARAGVVEVRRGATGGIVVRSGNVPAALVGFDVELRAREMIELVEARRPVEMELARLAAMRATEKDFEQMAEATAMLHAAQERDDVMHAENLFHYLIGRAARSDMLARYQHEILEAKAVLVNSWTVQMDPVPLATVHEETLAALRTRDPEVVRAAMDHHLHDLEDTVERMRRGRDRDARRSAKAKKPS